MNKYSVDCRASYTTQIDASNFDLSSFPNKNTNPDLLILRKRFIESGDRFVQVEFILCLVAESSDEAEQIAYSEIEKENLFSCPPSAEYVFSSISDTYNESLGIWE